MGPAYVGSLSPTIPREQMQFSLSLKILGTVSTIDYVDITANPPLVCVGARGPIGPRDPTLHNPTGAMFRLPDTMKTDKRGESCHRCISVHLDLLMAVETIIDQLLLYLVGG
ncbi:hypothetical protein ACJJTC_002851 [Scirpophaga incertulas]